MENDTLLKGVRIPEQGFIEIQISSDGNVILTGESVRYDDHDYYRPVGPALIGSAIPAVDAVEEKQGFWKAAGTGHPKPGNQRYRKQDQWTVYKCSNCGATNGRNHSDPYCRHCGARMLVDNCRYCYNDDRRREEGDE